MKFHIAFRPQRFAIPEARKFDRGQKSMLRTARSGLLRRGQMAHGVMGLRGNPTASSTFS